MAIPGSGKVSIGDIRTELQNGGTNNFSLQFAGRPYIGAPGTFQNPIYVPINESSTSKPNNLQPFAISEWRNYNHSENKPCSVTSFTTPILGPFYTYYRVNIAGTAGNESQITITGNGTTSHAVAIFTSYPFNDVGAIVSLPFASSILYSSTTINFRKGIDGTTPQVLHLVFWQDYN